MLIQKDFLTSSEPQCEKTGLWGFQPGPTQTSLYRLKKGLKLEIFDLTKVVILLSV